MSQSQLPGAYPEEDQQAEPATGSGISLREEKPANGEVKEGEEKEEVAEEGKVEGEEEEDLEVEEGDDNVEIEEEEKVAPPPTEDLPQLLGYELLASSFGVELDCPAPDEEPQEEDTANKTDVVFERYDEMTEKDAREALVRWVSTKKCHGKKAAEEMAITKIIPTTAFHYKLDSFLESRSTAYAWEAYTGQEAGEPKTGKAPLPWDIPAEPQEIFKNHTVTIQVPNSANVKTCHKCRGSGKMKCIRCKGKGKSGVGDHKRKCLRCLGKAMEKCSACLGSTKLLIFIRLTITYKCNSSEHIVEITDMPDELVRDVQGKLIYEEVATKVHALSNFPEEEINENSKKFINKHSTASKQQRILKQRQTLCTVPVSEIHYTWKDAQTRRFWTYGKENNVYCDDYPQQSCCSIL